jgi:dihydrofolate reductase
MKIGRVNIIVAASSNMVIGKDNDLPWRLPTDLKYFKEITSGSPVVMGRKCWESIPEKFRPLPNRKNVIITRNTDYKSHCDADVRHNLNLALEEQRYGVDDIFVIGGSDIYKEAFKFADRVYLTRIFEHVDGDIYLDGFNEDEWTFVKHSDTMMENGFTFRFEQYDRKN